MTEIITQILVEVLKIFGIAMKELKRGSASVFSNLLCVIRILTKPCAEKFLRKLARITRTDLENTLKKLDRLTEEEAVLAHEEVFGHTAVVYNR